MLNERNGGGEVARDVMGVMLRKNGHVVRSLLPENMGSSKGV